MTENNQRIGKLPPQNIEAEQSLLGSLLLDKDAIIKIADIVHADDFYKDAHAKIFECVLELYEKHEPIDLLSLGNRLEEKRLLERVGGRSYLSSLVSGVPTSSHVVSYANIVEKKGTLRRLISAATEINEISYDEEQETDILLDIAEQKLFQVSQKYMKKSFTPITDVLHDAFDRIDEIHKEGGKLRGVPTSFSSLDNVLAGLQNSDLVILAARPSMGKTTLALDIARNVAVKSKIPVAIFSLEMSKEQLVDRMICAEANVDLWKMRTGKLSSQGENDDFSRIGHAIGILSDSKVFIDDTASCNILEIRTKARRLQAEHNLGLIIVDYLQLIEGRRQENRVQEVSEISRKLKSIAKELNVPVLSLSQLSRSVESRDGHIPRLADLRESGSIEQDADVVLFIYREAMYNKDLPPDMQNISKIVIAKHRNGPTGEVDLYFDPNRVTFKNLEKKLASEPRQHESAPAEAPPPPPPSFNS